MDRLRSLVYGAALLLIIGWVLYIGRDVFVPIVLGAVVVYVIVGLTHALRRVPCLGRALPLQVRYLLALLVIAFGSFRRRLPVIANKEPVLALAPQYQESLLAAIQRVAVSPGIETEPTWATIAQGCSCPDQHPRRARIDGDVGLVDDRQRRRRAAVCDLPAAREHVPFPSKLDHLSSDPRSGARIRRVAQDINARIGSYLALKTLLSVLLGAVCWVIMRWFGLEFALFWAVLITLLNFIPYIGSFLAVIFPVAMAIAQFQDPSIIFYVAASLIVVSF